MKRIIYIFFIFTFVQLSAQEKGTVNKFISFSASGITPIGIFAEDWNIGGAAYIGYGWLFNNKWAFFFQTGYNKYRLKSDSPYSENPKLSMLPIQFGGRRYFGTGNFQYFAEALSGINFIRLFYKEGEATVDERETHVNFQIGGGLSYYLNDSWGIEASILYNSHLINPSIPYNLTGFEYGIGVNWIID